MWRQKRNVCSQPRVKNYLSSNRSWQRMMNRCVAPGCSNIRSNRVSLFKFPSNAILRRNQEKQVQWMQAWLNATKHSVPCSDHFTEDCYEVDSVLASQFGMSKRSRLKPGAVLTVFHWPSTVQVCISKPQERSSCKPQERSSCKRTLTLAQWWVRRMVGGVLKSKRWVDHKTVHQARVHCTCTCFSHLCLRMASFGNFNRLKWSLWVLEQHPAATYLLTIFCHNLYNHR